MLLRQIIELIPRTAGNGWEIAKIHEQLHVAFNILLFGAHQNLHTGLTEHNHIENTRKPSKQVQGGCSATEILDTHNFTEIVYLLRFSQNINNQPSKIFVYYFQTL